MSSTLPVTSFPKNKIRILFLEGLHQSAVDTLNAAGYTNIDYHTRSMPEDKLIKALQGVHIMGIRSKTQITENVIKNANRLLGLGCFCIGTNQVNLDCATEMGITVFNSPYSNTRSVAELVIGNIIMLIRRVPEKNKAAHTGIWLKDATGSYELRGKTLGIIGYGHIGSQVSVLAEGFGMNIIYYDTEMVLTLGNAVAVGSMDELLKRSDIVTLHVPGTPETKNMLTAERQAQMKSGSILLNLSRGDVVDLEALTANLRGGHISGAAIDVYPEEPKKRGALFSTPLQGLDNVILTPHVGGSTQEAQKNIGIDVATKLIKLLDKGSTTGSLTVPPLNLPTQDKTHRIVHIHLNQPGVLSEINNILSELGLNILAQYLNTNSKIGLVVLDVDQNTTPKTLEKLKTVKGTLRSWILY
ncbi:MAG TPA: phosphoglycerate dehydrogenase [Flavobacteriales bacterium]|nr:phosphoglycerate dehydrogenase [Flavobacteriales bacterium]